MVETDRFSCIDDEGNVCTVIVLQKKLVLKGYTDTNHAYGQKNFKLQDGQDVVAIDTDLKEFEIFLTKKRITKISP